MSEDRGHPMDRIPDAIRRCIDKLWQRLPTDDCDPAESKDFELLLGKLVEVVDLYGQLVARSVARAGGNPPVNLPASNPDGPPAGN